MTAKEMLYRAELGYDFITGFSAAGILHKEWSLFFTKAQMEIVKKKLPVSPIDMSFEETELLSQQFSEIIKDAVDNLGNSIINPSVDQTGGIDNRSLFFDMPEDFLYGIYEDIDYKDEDECNISEVKKVITTGFAEYFEYFGGGDTTDWTPEFIEEFVEKHGIIAYDIIKDRFSYYVTENVKKKYRVKPINNNYYIGNVKNPFKTVDRENPWRIKNRTVDSNIRHEIISTNIVDNYYLRYMMIPPPIIVFDDDYNGDYDTIQGVVLNDVYTSGVSMDPVLNDSICDIIINRAIILAQESLGDFQAAQYKTMDNAGLN